MTYQDQKASKNPNHEKKKTRPYLLIGFSTGIDLALWLAGLISGSLQSSETLKAMATTLLFVGMVKYSQPDVARS